MIWAIANKLTLPQEEEGALSSNSPINPDLDHHCELVFSLKLKINILWSDKGKVNLEQNGTDSEGFVIKKKELLAQ